MKSVCPALAALTLLLPLGVKADEERDIYHMEKGYLIGMVHAVCALEAEGFISAKVSGLMLHQVLYENKKVSSQAINATRTYLEADKTVKNCSIPASKISNLLLPIDQSQ